MEQANSDCFCLLDYKFASCGLAAEAAGAVGGKGSANWKRKATATAAVETKELNEAERVAQWFMPTPPASEVGLRCEYLTRNGRRRGREREREEFEQEEAG